jgi:hypothetical protein
MTGKTLTNARGWIRTAMIRRPSLLVLSIGLVLFAAAARSQDYPALCEGSAIVTGTGETTRAEGLAHALRDVLVKRSGDPGLLHDPRVDPLAAKAADMVEDYLYLDRMSDQPKHDEQGTRDRPYTLIARFSPPKIDAALAELGDRPWLAARPKLLVRITITDARRGNYPLTADGDNDERHRQALLAAAVRFGMRVVLGPGDKVPEDKVPGTNATEDAMVPGALLVTGTLRWSDADPGWRGVWRSAGDPGSEMKTWGIRGVSFDDAYRDLVWGAMAIESGHDLPRAEP